MTVGAVMRLTRLSLTLGLPLALASLGAIGCTEWRNATELPPSESGPMGLPCDVDQILSPCRACHGAVPTQKAPMPMVSYTDLVGPSPSDHTKTVAQLSVERMANTTDPMPPTPSKPVPAADQATFAAWVKAGMPTGSCQPPTGPDPLNAEPTCTSGQTSFIDEGSTMAPGEACISCHAARRGPRFTFAGTLYPSGHEPDDCEATNIAGAQIIITDANGVDQRPLTPNSVGNFYSRGTIALPYTARVVFNGKTRAMVTPQKSGDCNDCHTQSGDNDAPGRITLPY